VASDFICATTLPGATASAAGVWLKRVMATERSWLVIDEFSRVLALPWESCTKIKAV
jgi:hypothetical protein